MGIFIFSPLLVVCVLSLLTLVIGLRRYRLRLARPEGDLNDHTGTFIMLGTLRLSVSGSMLLLTLVSAFIPARMVLLVLFLSGLVLFVGGAFILRRLIIMGKEYIFPAIITGAGFVLMAFLFPLLISMHEPFIFMYACIVVMSIPVQMAVLYSWKKRRSEEWSETR